MTRNLKELLKDLKAKAELEHGFTGSRLSKIMSGMVEARGLEQYQSGKLSGTDFIGATGKVILIIEKDKNKKFPDKNVVADYVVKESGVPGMAFLRRKE